MYDIFFISENPEHSEYLKLKSRFPIAKRANTLSEARKRALTRLYWVVWEDTVILDTFNFDYLGDPDKLDKPFALLNTNGSYGINLIAKKIAVTPETERTIFANVNEVDIIASKSATTPFDIVFISNGEPIAEENHARLKQLTSGAPNRVLHVSGVNGRTAAFKKAAKKVDTHCFIAVFAKIKVDEQFDWSWTSSSHEDRHYVFEALNPVNGLIYGHQAVIAYNKHLVLNHPGDQIDFTMAQSYKSVPVMSGTALYNMSPSLTWRTAFREALKLRLFMIQGDNQAKERLNVWLSSSTAEFGEWSERGAQDAVEYFDSVNGDYERLLPSYDWKWVDEYFRKKYS